MDKKAFNVVIADKQYLIIESLKYLIQNSTEYRILSIAENQGDLNNFLQSNEADLIITDYYLFDVEGIAYLKKLQIQFPKIAILVITDHLNRNEINELTKIGIKAIISKMADEEELFQAMASAIKNKKYYSAAVLDLLTQTNSPGEESMETGHLTPSEIEIIKQIAAGHTTKEIAEKKHVSFHTVMSHRKNIFKKLQINNASELLMYAVRAGIIEDIEYYI